MFVKTNFILWKLFFWLVLFLMQLQCCCAHHLILKHQEFELFPLRFADTNYFQWPLSFVFLLFNSNSVFFNNILLLLQAFFLFCNSYSMEGRPGKFHNSYKRNCRQQNMIPTENVHTHGLQKNQTKRTYKRLT